MLFIITRPLSENCVSAEPDSTRPDSQLHNRTQGNCTCTATRHSAVGGWRLSPESNRGQRLCRPLHNHSATQPLKQHPAGRVSRCADDHPASHLTLQQARLQTRACVHGAGNETRTRDPNLGKVVLYQLSYSRMDSSHEAAGILFRHEPMSSRMPKISADTTVQSPCVEDSNRTGTAAFR